MANKHITPVALLLFIALVATGVFGISALIQSTSSKPHGDLKYQLKISSLDAAKVNTANMAEAPIVTLLALPNGNFSVARLIDADLVSDSVTSVGKLSETTRLASLSGDAVQLDGNGTTGTMILKDGSTVKVKVLLPAVTYLTPTTGPNIFLSLSKGKIRDKQLIDVFAGQTFTSGHLIAGLVNAGGSISNAVVNLGAGTINDTYAEIIRQSMLIFPKISTVTTPLPISSAEAQVLAAETEVLGIDSDGFLTPNNPVYNPKTGTWSTPSATGAPLGNPTIAVTQQQVSQAISNLATTNQLNLTPVVASGIRSVTSSSDKIGVTTSGSTVNLSLNLTNSINSDSIINGSVAEADLADSAITENKIKDGAITDGKLSQITSTNKVAGSAIQLAVGGGIENNTGLSLLTSCATNQILKWDGSAWSCATDSGGSGSSIDVQEGDTTITSAAAFMDFLAADFIVTNSPAGEANVAIDYSNSGITRKGQNETIAGTWTFSSTPTITNLPNSSLTNSSVTINTGSGLTGGAAVSLGGSITLSSTLGTDIDSSEIADGSIVNTDISASAAIAFSKLASLTAGNILVGNGSNVATSVAMSGDVAIDNTGATTIQANSVALGTDTTGNYIATVSTGNGLSVSGSGSESAAATISLVLPAATDALSSTTSSGSGLELTSSGLSLIQGCSNGQLLKWNETSDVWECSADTSGSASTVVAENGTTVVSSLSTLDFLGTDFIVSESPSGEANVSIDYSNAKITRSDQTQTISGAWTFSNGLTVSSGSVSLPAGVISNTELENSSITVTAGTGLTGGGAVSLGGTVTLNSSLGTAIDSSEITDGSIVNDDINASAGISLSKLASGTDGQIIIANGSGVPTYTTVSGDVAISNAGVTTISANSVALGTDTTGNYVATVTGDSQISVSGSGSENAGVSLSIATDSIGDSQLAFNTGQNLTTASSPTFAGLSLANTLNQLVLGTTNTTTISSVAPSASRTATIPALSGNDSFIFADQAQTLTNKTISGSANTLTNIGNSSLTNSSLTVTAGTGLTGGGSVSLGSSVTLNSALGTDIDNSEIAANAAIAFSKLASLTAGNILVGNGSNVATSVAMSGDITIDSSGATTIGANTVALATDTTGNYVATVSTGNGLSVSGVGSENATASLSLVLPSATDALSSTTNSGSGLELTSSGLSLIQGCANGEVLKWNETNDYWACSTDSTGGSVNSFETISTTSGTSPVADSTTDTLTLTAGTGITVTGNATNDSITLAATLGTDIDSSEITDGSIVNDDINASAAIAFSKLAALSSGNILVGSSGNVATSVAMSGDVAIDNTGATTIQANSVALGTDTTGNFVATVTGSSHISVSGSGSENATVSLSLAADSVGLTEIADSLTLDGANLTIASSDATNDYKTIFDNSSTGDIATLIQITTSGTGATITTGLDLSDADIATAIALGSNDITVGGVTLAATELALLDGLSGTILTSGNYTSTLDSVYVNVGESPAAGDITGSFTGGLTIGANTVALATDTTGNYIATITGDSQVSVSGSGSENAGVTLGINADSIGDSQLAFNTGQNLTTTSTPTFGALTLNGVLTLANSETLANSTDGQFTFGRNDAGTVTLTAADNDSTAALTILPGGAAALTLGNASTTTFTVVTDSTGDGEIVLPGNSIGNAELVNSSLTVTAGSGLTTGGAVSLGSAVTLNIGAGNGITVNGDDVAVRVAASADALSSTTSSGSGLEVLSSGLTLLQGCSNNQILKWNETSDIWECNSDNTGSGAAAVTENGSAIVASLTTLDFLGADFTVTESPSGEANISLDYTNSKITREDQTQSISGAWTFSNGLTVSSGTVSLPSGQIDNTELANSSITVTAGTGLTGGGAVSLGGTVTLNSSLGTAIDTSEITDNTITLTDVANSLTFDANLTLVSDSATNDYKLILDNSSTGDVANLFQITTSGTGATVGTALDLSDADIATAIALGSNDVTVGGVTLAATELALLDGLSGTILTSGNYASTLDSIYVNVGESPAAGDITGSFSGGLTVAANAVALATDTTGNYVATITGDSQISVSGSGSENAGVSLSIAADSIGDSQLAFNTGQNLTTTSSPTFAALTLNGVLTLANSETLSNGTDGTIILGRNDAGTVTLSAADDNSTAALSILPGGAAAFGLGGSSTTAITLTTDSTGDAEVVLPANSIGNSELVNSSLTVTAGTGLTGGGSVSLGGTVTLNSSLGTAIDSSEITDDSIVNADINASAAIAFSKLASLTSGNILVGSSGNVATSVAMSGDVAIDNTGTTTIQANSVALTTDTTGNYVATITAGNGISGSSSSEGGTPTIALAPLTGDWDQTGAFDISLNNASAEIKLLESAGATYFGTLDVGDLSANATYTFSGTSGTVITDANYTTTLDSVYVNVSESPAAGDITGSFTGGLTIGANTVALATDTTGNYVATVSTGNGLSVSGVGSENATASLSLVLPAATDALSTTTNSGSGLETTASGLSLLQGCANNEILKWNETSDYWACSTDAGGSTNSFETISVSNGTSPVADSATDTLTLSDGSGITITGTAGTDTISIAATLGTSIANSELDNDTIDLTKFADSLTLDGADLTIASSDATNDYKFILDNSSTGAIATLFQVTTSGSGASVGIAVDLSDADIDTALALGSNDITVGGVTLASTELALLDGLSGTILTSGNYTSTLDAIYVNVGESPAAGDITGSFTGGLTIGANTVALATDTTGNYVATISGDSQISVSGSGSENAGVSLSIAADSIGDSQLAFNTGQNLTSTSTPTFAALTLNGALTLANSETVSNGTNGTITFGRNDAGTVTINAADDDSTAALTILPGGAAAFTLGGSSTTAITLTTDSTGDAEVVLPANSVGNSELVNSSLTVTAGTGLTGGGSVSLGGSVTLNSALGTSIANSELDNDTIDLDKVSASLTLDEETTIAAVGALNFLIGNNVTFTTTGSGAIIATDLSCTNCIGTTEIADLTLGTDTAGNYVATITGNTQVGVSGSGSENAGVTLSLNADSVTLSEVADTLTLDAANLTLASSDSTNDYKIVFDNSSTGTIANLLQVTTSGSGAIVTTALDLSDADIDTAIALGSNDVTVGGVTLASSELALLDGLSGTILTSGNYTSTLDAIYVNVGESPTSADISGSFSGGLTIAANAVALATDTTGNYVATVSTGNGLSVSGVGSENATAALSLVLPAATDALSSTTNSGSGLELTTSGLSLLQGCANNEILKWNETSDYWACSTDSTGGSINSFETISTTSGTSPVADSSTDTLTLTAGTGITVTGDSTTDTITLAATLGTSIANSELDNDTIDLTKVADSLTLDGADLTIASSDATNDYKVILDNSSTGAIANLLQVTTSGSGATITTALDLSDADIDTAIALGSNDVTVGGVTLAATELALLDGLSGTILTSGNYTSTLDSVYVNVGESPAAGDITGSFTGGLTIGANTVALATDTTGNYVATITGDSQVSVSGSGSENAGVSLSIAANSIADAQLAFNTGQHLTSTSTPTFGALTLNGALTLANSETLANSTDGQFTFGRNDAGTVTVTAADNDSTAALTILPGGAAAFGLGGSSTTAITLTTDSTGDAEVVLPANSVGNSELVNSSLTVTAGTGLSGGGAVSLGGSVSLSATLGTSIANSEIDDDAIDLDKVSASLTLDEATTITAGGALAFNIGNNVTFQTSGSGAIIATDLNCTNCIGPTEITDLTLGTDTAGNYVATITGNTQVGVSGSGSENAGVTLSLNADSVTLSEVADTLTLDAANLTLASSDSTNDYKIVFDNSSTGTIANLLQVTTSGSGAIVTTALDLSDADIDTAIALGSNDVTVGGVTLSSTELALLDGLSGTILTSGNYTSTLDSVYVNVGESPTSADISGSFSGGLTVAANAVALATDTTGNFIATITGNTQVGVSGSGSEDASVTLSLNTDSVTLSEVADSLTFDSANLTLVSSDSTNDYKLVIDNSSTGAIAALMSFTSTGVGGTTTTAIDVTDTDITNAISLADNTILGTTAVIDFTNFDVDGSGNLDVSGTLTAGSGNEVLTLSTGKIDADALTLISSGTTGSTSSRSGLQTSSDGLGLLLGCTDNYILKWTDASGWSCAQDETGGGGGAFTSSGGTIDKTTAADTVRFQYGDAADTQLTIDSTTNQVIATADAVVIDLSSGATNTGIVTDGVDGLYITVEFGNGTTNTNSALHLDVNPVNTPSGDETFYAINIDGLSAGTNATETAINIGANWDNAISFQNSETLTNSTDDMIVFTGVGGSDNTDLRLDLDGTYPVFDSPTDSYIGFADDIYVADSIWTTGNSVNKIDLVSNGIGLESYLSAQYNIDNDNNDTIESYKVVTNGGQSTLFYVYQDGASGTNAKPLVGIGTASTPTNALQVLSTTGPQFRISYDSSNYTTFDVSSTGVLTLDYTGSAGGILLADFTNGGSGCSALETNASGTLTCGTDDTGGSSTLQGVYDNDVNGSDVTVSLNSTDGSIIFSEAAGTNVQFTASAAPTTDMVSITNSGQGVTTNGINGLSIAFIQADDADATDVNYGLNINVTAASGDAGDILAALNLDVTSPTANNREIGLNIGSGFDEDIFFASASARIRIQDGGTLNFTDGSFGQGATKDQPNARLIEYFSSANYGVFEAGGFVNIDGSYYQDNFSIPMTQVTADVTSRTNRFGDHGNWVFDEGGTGGGSTATNSTTYGCTLSQGGSGSGGGTNTQFGRLEIAPDMGTHTHTAADSTCVIHLGIGTGTNTGGILNAAYKYIQYFKVGFSAGFTNNNSANQAFVGAHNYTVAWGQNWNSINSTHGFIGFANLVSTTTATDAQGGTQWNGFSRVGNAISSVACSTAGNISTVSNAWALMRIEARATNDVHFFIDNDISNGISMSECGAGITNNISTRNLNPAINVVHQQNVATSGNSWSMFVDLYAHVQDDPKPESAPITFSDTPATETKLDPISGADIAEYYQMDKGYEAINNGDIVVLGATPGQAVVASRPHDRKLLGVVSETPGLFLGQSEGKNMMPIALTGRVPVRVSNKNGAIKLGDPITSSDEPGVGMKATKPGKIIGTAMEDFDASEGRIMVNINVGYYLGDEETSPLLVQKTPLTIEATDTTNVMGIATDSAGLAANAGDFTVGKPSVFAQLTKFLGDIIVDGQATFNNSVTFLSTTIFKGSTTFEKPVIFNEDTAGYAVIKAGDRSVDVSFANEYPTEPLVNASLSVTKITPEIFADRVTRGLCSETAGMDTCQDNMVNEVLGNDVKFAIVSKSTQGFMILLNKPTQVDMTFSWQATAVSKTNTSVSKGDSNLKSALQNVAQTSSDSAQLIQELNAEIATGSAILGSQISINNQLIEAAATPSATPAPSTAP